MVEPIIKLFPSAEEIVRKIAAEVICQSIGYPCLEKAANHNLWCGVCVAEEWVRIHDSKEGITS